MDVQKITVFPAPGIKLFDPSRNDFIPLEGRTVVRSQYWLRRIADGGATEAPENTDPEQA